MLDTRTIELTYTTKQEVIEKLENMLNEMRNKAEYTEDKGSKLEYLDRKHKLVYLIDYARNISKDTDLQLELRYEPLLVTGTYKKVLILKGELPKMAERKYSNDYEDYVKKQKELLEKFFDKLFGEGMGMVEIDGNLIEPATFEKFPNDLEFLGMMNQYVRYSQIPGITFSDLFFIQLREEIQEGIEKEYEETKFSETILEVYKSKYFRAELKKAIETTTEDLKKELLKGLEQGTLTETYVDSGELVYVTEQIQATEGDDLEK